jgi:hypothetical protein
MDFLRGHYVIYGPVRIILTRVKSPQFLYCICFSILLFWGKKLILKYYEIFFLKFKELWNFIKFDGNWIFWKFWNLRKFLKSEKIVIFLKFLKFFNSFFFNFRILNFLEKLEILWNFSILIHLLRNWRSKFSNIASIYVKIETIGLVSSQLKKYIKYSVYSVYHVTDLANEIVRKPHHM